jgi:hypothetical protein
MGYLILVPTQMGIWGCWDGGSDRTNDYLLDAYVWKCIDTEIATRSHCMVWAGKACIGVMMVWHLLIRTHANEK